jgi:hypothetical protein
MREFREYISRYCFRFYRSPLIANAAAVQVALVFQQMRTGPFAGPTTVKPPTLPEDLNFVMECACPILEPADVLAATSLVAFACLCTPGE